MKKRSSVIEPCRRALAASLSNQTVITNAKQLLKVISDTLTQNPDWTALQANFPTLIQNAGFTEQALKAYLKTMPLHPQGYHATVLASADNPAVSLKAFYFPVDEGAISIHLYGTTGNPNNNCYNHPLHDAKQAGSIKTYIHDHNCLSLTHVLYIAPNITVTENMFEQTKNGIKLREAVQRNTQQARLDNQVTPYIHQLVIQKMPLSAKL